ADVGIVNDEFAFSDAYRQEFANALPGNGVKILKITDGAFRIDRAIDHFGCVIGLFRKRQQVRQLLLIEIQRRAVSRPMQADISHMGQPPGRGFVQMLKAGESSTVEEVLFQVPEGPLYFALRFRPAWPTGHRPEAIVSGEGQEARIVNGLMTVVATDNDLHVVIETVRGNAAQIAEGRNVLANRHGEVLTLDKMQILAARVSQDIAKCVDTALALGSEIDLVGGIIHLGLNTSSGFKAANELTWMAP